jgi:hypothetical protein
MTNLALYVVYISNIIVAGYIGILSLFSPQKATVSIFSNTYQSTEIIRLVGCLWLAIAILSVLGLWKPITFSPVLLLQVIYKGCWLLVVALPAIQDSKPYPAGMAIFFMIWVLLLPFVIPWAAWYNLEAK